MNHEFFRIKAMKPKLQQQRTSCHWNLGETRVGRDKMAALPSLKTKYSEYWPVLTEFKPYAGPTLWTPSISNEKHKYPFLTLTPKEGSSSNQAIPLVSLTPRHNEDRQKPLVSGTTDKPMLNRVLIDGSEDFATSTGVILPPIDTKESLKLHGHEDNSKTQTQTQGIIFKPSRRHQSPIIPDVFSLGTSPRRPAKAEFKLPSLTHSHASKNANGDKGNAKTHWSFNEDKLIQGMQTLPSDRNEQDKGTLFSKQHYAMYSHLTRDPTFLPVLQNEALCRQSQGFAKNEVINEDCSSEYPDQIHLNTSQNKGPRFSTRLSKQQVRARRHYIRSRAHHMSKKSSASLGCVGHQTIVPPMPNLPNISKEFLDEDGLPKAARADEIISTQNGATSTNTAKIKGHVISSHFCDVLGQKTCRRCREFYCKHFNQPLKDRSEVCTTPVSLTRESTTMVPTVGLQKIVIRVKDDEGKMAVAAVGVNPGMVGRY